MNLSVSGTIDQKTHLKKLRGVSTPLAPPLDPPMNIAKIFLSCTLLYR